MLLGAHFLYPLKPTNKDCLLGTLPYLKKHTPLPFWKASFLAFHTLAHIVLEQRHFIFQTWLRIFGKEKSSWVLHVQRVGYKYVGTFYFYSLISWKTSCSHWSQGIPKQPGAAAPKNGLFLTWHLHNRLFSSVQTKICDKISASRRWAYRITRTWTSLRRQLWRLDWRFGGEGATDWFIKLRILFRLA